MNLGSVIVLLIQVIYNIVQFSLPDLLNLLQTHTSLMLVVVVGANSFLAVLQVYFHIDPKEIEVIVQGILNLAKDYSTKPQPLTEIDLTAIENEGTYWIKKLITYLTNIRLQKTKKIDANQPKT